MKTIPISSIFILSICISAVSSGQTQGVTGYVRSSLKIKSDKDILTQQQEANTAKFVREVLPQELKKGRQIGDCTIEASWMDQIRGNAFLFVRVKKGHTSYTAHIPPEKAKLGFQNGRVFEMRGLDYYDASAPAFSARFLLDEKQQSIVGINFHILTKYPADPLAPSDYTGLMCWPPSNDEYAIFRR